MTMHEEIMDDLRSYRRIVFVGSMVLLALIMLALFISIQVKWYYLSLALVGAFAGTFLSSINIFALGYAFYVLAVQKGPRRALLWPIFSFLLLCGVALYLALLKPDYIFGFSLALTSPIIFGAIIALRD